MIAIVDYGMGNLRSVANAIAYCGAEPQVTDRADDLAEASHLVLPGVGAFGDAMARLSERGLIEPLTEQVLRKGKPLLGICLGMEVLAARSSEHGEHRGLGWFDADVVRLVPRERGLKVPHMGWNTIAAKVDHPVLRGLTPQQLTFYFVHSYHMACRSTGDVVATCDYGGSFAAIVGRDNTIATQFHPEKSQDSGLQLLTNFLRWRP